MCSFPDKLSNYIVTVLLEKILLKGLIVYKNCTMGKPQTDLTDAYLPDKWHLEWRRISKRIQNIPGNKKKCFDQYRDSDEIAIFVGIYV